MINLKTLELGQTVYEVVQKNNMFSRKKLSFVDDQGNEWTRYDRQIWQYTVRPITFCGKVEQTITGTVINPLDYWDEYFFQEQSTGDLISFSKFDYPEKVLFVTKLDALTNAKEMEAIKNAQPSN